MKDSLKLRAIVGSAARSVALTDALLRSAAHKPTQSGKTNPTRQPNPRAISDAAIVAEMFSMTDDDISIPKPRSAAHNSAQPRSGAHKNSAFERTKPKSPEPIQLAPLHLTTRQLAAARLVVQGLRSSEIAGRIGTITQTINRWKRLPGFAEEVRRLHELLAIRMTDAQ